jgi:hypothetical protein
MPIQNGIHQSTTVNARWDVFTLQYFITPPIDDLGLAVLRGIVLAIPFATLVLCSATDFFVQCKGHRRTSGAFPAYQLEPED